MRLLTRRSQARRERAVAGQMHLVAAELAAHVRAGRTLAQAIGDVAEDTPEPPFDGCGTSWNTFLTRGRCPGCRHQWQWTSCLRCHGWSLHEDWYETV